MGDAEGGTHGSGIRRSHGNQEVARPSTQPEFVQRHSAHRAHEGAVGEVTDEPTILDRALVCRHAVRRRPLRHQSRILLLAPRALRIGQRRWDPDSFAVVHGGRVPFAHPYEYRLMAAAAPVEAYGYLVQLADVTHTEPLSKQRTHELLDRVPLAVETDTATREIHVEPQMPWPLGDAAPTIRMTRMHGPVNLGPAGVRQKHQHVESSVLQLVGPFLAQVAFVLVVRPDHDGQGALVLAVNDKIGHGRTSLRAVFDRRSAPERTCVLHKPNLQTEKTQGFDYGKPVREAGLRTEETHSIEFHAVHRREAQRRCRRA